MKTVLLDQKSWDLVVDLNGNIALANNPYSLAQDAASAIRTFQGEVYYDTLQGVPYWADILGEAPPVALMKAKFVDAALTVPEVTRAVCYINSITKRVVSGQVQVTDATGATVPIGF